MKAFLLYSLVLLLTACKNGGEKPVEAIHSRAVTGPGAHSAAFNRSFAGLTSGYFRLGDQLAARNDSGIAQSARNLVRAADSLQLAELKTDSALFTAANGFALSISAETQGLMGETNIAGKRRSYQMISDLLYDLLRAIRYDQATLYRYYCATAFEDQGASWLADTPAIRNPYTPVSGSPCGKIKDTIDYRKK